MGIYPRLRAQLDVALGLHLLLAEFRFQLLGLFLAKCLFEFGSCKRTSVSFEVERIDTDRHIGVVNRDEHLDDFGFETILSQPCPAVSKACIAHFLTIHHFGDDVILFGDILETLERLVCLQGLLHQVLRVEGV